jgi:DNA-binding PadR family transcriptional regulator
VRRKAGTLIDVEQAILEAGARLAALGTAEFHGYLLAKELRDADQARRLVGHGTLYKALERLERAGLIASRWEDPQLAAGEGRPRRRLYHITTNGTAVLAAIDKQAAVTLPRRLQPRTAQ